jgi:hypothetical protein
MDHYDVDYKQAVAFREEVIRRMWLKIRAEERKRKTGGQREHPDR